VAILGGFIQSISMHYTLKLIKNVSIKLLYY